MSFTLPKLPYKHNELEPYIDTKTMEVHYGKHHAAYVDNLNKTLENHQDLLGKKINDLLSDINSVPEDLRQKVINHGGGHANHSFFWRIMRPKPKPQPEGNLIDAIESSFGSFESFKERFTEKAMGVFGSGWGFLILNKDKKLQLKRHSFQNSPLSQGNIPVLCIDVWEHAYYLKYQNRRADYIEAWWNVVNWQQVEEEFSQAPL